MCKTQHSKTLSQRMFNLVAESRVEDLLQGFMFFLFVYFQVVWTLFFCGMKVIYWGCIECEEWKHESSFKQSAFLGLLFGWPPLLECLPCCTRYECNNVFGFVCLFVFFVFFFWQRCMFIAVFFPSAISIATRSHRFPRMNSSVYLWDGTQLMKAEHPNITYMLATRVSGLATKLWAKMFCHAVDAIALVLAVKRKSWM